MATIEFNQSVAVTEKIQTNEVTEPFKLGKLWKYKLSDLHNIANNLGIEIKGLCKDKDSILSYIKLASAKGLLSLGIIDTQTIKISRPS